MLNLLLVGDPEAGFAEVEDGKFEDALVVERQHQRFAFEVELGGLADGLVEVFLGGGIVVGSGPAPAAVVSDADELEAVPVRARFYRHVAGQGKPYPQEVTKDQRAHRVPHSMDFSVRVRNPATRNSGGGCGLAQKSRAHALLVFRVLFFGEGRIERG